MAKIEGRAKLHTEAVLVLNEAEIGALDALAGYGADQFLKVFYEHMGKAYLQPHEAGLRSLFEGAGALRGIMERARDARDVFDGRQRLKATT